MEIYEACVSLMVRALVVGARWAGRTRRFSLERACTHAEAGQVAELEDAVAFRNARLEVIKRRPGEERPKHAYPLVERLHILWLTEY